MSLFPKLNSFDLEGLPSLASLCPDASTSLWSAAKVMSVKRCDKLKTLALVIPQIRKLENNIEKDSTAHNKDENEGISSGSCTPYSCGPMTKPTSRTNIVQILPVQSIRSLRYFFLSTVAKLLVSLKDLKVGNCEKIEQVIAKADTECADQEITFPRLNSMTLEDLPNLICFSTEAYTLKLPSLMELKHIDEEVEFSSEEFYEDVHTDSTE
ncbi:hypothetical protein ACE6H2_023290 [Prunus campanulata]